MKFLIAGLAVLAMMAGFEVEATLALKKHHKKHHKHHKAAVKLSEKQVPAAAPQPESTMVAKLKDLENKVDASAATPTMLTAKIDVNGPLPADFRALFSQAVSIATGAAATDVKVLEENVVKSKGNVIVEVVFTGPVHIVEMVRQQAADADSALATGSMYAYLVAKDPIDDVSVPASVTAPGVNVDTEMPYGELEPFGREDTAHELTEDAIHESDGMVDQMEKAEVAEEKRSVFRALTRLRGAAITSFDGVARSQTGNIDEYNKTHKWRKTHPLRHLASEESDVTKWAFPDASD